MKPELKNKWVGALCSGRYAQSKGGLVNYRGYCCLGVLCEVAGVDSASNSFIESDNGTYLMLPGSIQKALADLNDDNVPFEVIAGLISEAL